MKVKGKSQGLSAPENSCVCVVGVGVEGNPSTGVHHCVDGQCVSHGQSEP